MVHWLISSIKAQMDGTCIDGGVTGGGRLYGAFLNELELRNTSSVAHIGKDRFPFIPQVK